MNSKTSRRASLLTQAIAAVFSPLSSLLRSVLLVVLPICASAADFTYETNGNQITINSYTGPGGAVVIPATINGLPVTRIAESAFSHRISITSVVIPSSVITIGEAAFAGCSNMTNVTISEGVAGIGFEAFAACSSLAQVTIPDSVTNIASEAFSGLTSLTSITVGPLNTAYSSVDGVLFNKIQTTLIQFPAGKRGGYSIPNSVTNIGFMAFYRCANLTGLNIPDTVIAIGQSAFAECTNLLSVTLPQTITVLPDGVFFGCSNLTSVTIPRTVTTIGDSAFAYCPRLTGITLPDKLTTIKDSAFFECTALTNVTIPKTVTTILDSVFFGCTNLTGVFFEGNRPTLEGESILFNSNATVYYLPRTTGWESPFDGHQPVLWNPQTVTADTAFGFHAGQFGFTIAGNPNIPVVIESSSSLTNPIWTPLSADTLTAGSLSFTDPQSTNHSARFYRLRSP